MGRNRQGERRRRGPMRRLLRRLALAVLLAVVGSVSQVLVLRFVDPPFSAFMVARQVEALRAGDRGFRVDYRWRDARDISPQLAVAVIAAEDQRFAGHHGFDLEAIRAAAERNARGGRVPGASAISEQTAKNLFQWRGRS